MDDESILAAVKRLSEVLTPGDLEATLNRITTAAVEVLPEVDYASITVKHADGRLETSAPTDDVLCDIDAAQYELQEGPCYEAATETVHVTAPHLATDERFPRYAPVAVQKGVLAQAGIRLFDAPKSNGALNLYSKSEGSFQDLGVLGQLFAHQSAMALDYARQIDQLQQAVQSRQLIGEAVGMVMERYDLKDANAFAVLTRLSSERNLKLRTVAEEIVADKNREGR